jgi:hypothetical protein
VLELSNVATSSGLLGTVSGVQFETVFQSLLAGSKFQVALPAWRTSAAARKPKVQKTGKSPISAFYQTLIPADKKKRNALCLHRSATATQGVGLV